MHRHRNRKTFNLALPHQFQVRRWYSKVPAEPGFTKPAFQALSAKVQEAEKEGKTVLCSLMLDEMAIKKHAVLLERENLVKVCIKSLHDAGMVVVSLTCEGPACHFPCRQNWVHFSHLLI